MILTAFLACLNTQMNQLALNVCPKAENRIADGDCEPLMGL
jgi:hypothetical protein